MTFASATFRGPTGLTTVFVGLTVISAGAMFNPCARTITPVSSTDPDWQRLKHQLAAMAWHAHPHADDLWPVLLYEMHHCRARQMPSHTRLAHSVLSSCLPEHMAEDAQSGE